MATVKVSAVAGPPEVLEGFLCPVCLRDLVSVAQLQAHFEEKHATEDAGAIIKSFKSIYTKAKKLLNDSDSEDEGNSGGGGRGVGGVTNLLTATSGSTLLSRTHTGGGPWTWPQPPYRGPQRSHTTLFKRIRSDRIDSYVAETNKLLIRLDKLLTDIPSDPVKRKAHERALVSWADDRCVPLCPDCGRSFSNITRRRHHCRLCGGIMCHNCSLFLGMAFCQKLILPVHVASSLSSGHNGRRSPSNTRSSGGGSGGGGLMAGFGLRRSGSQGSLNSMVSVMDALTGEQHLRVCVHCEKRVSARDRAVELRQSKPLLSLLYGKLVADQERLLQLLPMYQRMAASLWNGEATHALSDASALRLKLVRLGDSVNASAQRLLHLGPVDRPAAPPPGDAGAEVVVQEVGPRQALLQRRVFQQAASFIKAHVLALEELPDAALLQTLQQRRRSEAAVRLAAEKQTAELAELRAEQALSNNRRHRHKELASSGGEPLSRFPHSKRSSSSPSSSNGPRHTGQQPVVGNEGWGGDSDAHVVTATDDPVVQQMNIIRNYIRQAREASRYDEVVTLERSLKELQEEYRRHLRTAPSPAAAPGGSQANAPRRQQ